MHDITLNRRQVTALLPSLVFPGVSHAIFPEDVRELAGQRVMMHWPNRPDVVINAEALAMAYALEAGIRAAGNRVIVNLPRVRERIDWWSVLFDSVSRVGVVGLVKLYTNNKNPPPPPVDSNAIVIETSIASANAMVSTVGQQAFQAYLRNLGWAPWKARLLAWVIATGANVVYQYFAAGTITYELSKLFRKERGRELLNNRMSWIGRNLCAATLPSIQAIYRTPTLVDLANERIVIDLPPISINRTNELYEALPLQDVRRIEVQYAGQNGGYHEAFRMLTFANRQTSSRLMRLDPRECPWVPIKQ